MKFCSTCGDEIDTKDGDNECRKCEDNDKKAKRNKRAAANRRARHEALTSMGLTRVKGALGGIYYE